MAERRSKARGIGRITAGIQPGTLVAKTAEFIRRQLPRWRDDATRPVEHAEPKLNIQLCMFLEARARSDFPMACFHHEAPQTGQHRVDVSASPPEVTVVGARAYSIYEPFLVLEGKRLPAPSPDRRMEYVTGRERRDGGIQRFKLGLHGAKLQVAVMIGYVQEGSARHRHREINSWISELAARPVTDVCAWKAGERLGRLHEDKKDRIGSSLSAHDRSGDVASNSIQLQHLLVEMHGGDGSSTPPKGRRRRRPGSAR
jgi:hypothetical protein